MLLKCDLHRLHEPRMRRIDLFLGRLVALCDCGSPHNMAQHLAHVCGIVHPCVGTPLEHSCTWPTVARLHGSEGPIVGDVPNLEALQ